MFWAWDITVLAGTAENNPKTQILKLSKGTITRIDIRFPSGCYRLVKIRLLRSEFQLIPLSGGEWVTGDGEIIPTEPYYELEDSPTELKFVGCSPQTRYNHTITVRISIIPPEVATPWQTMRDFVTIVKKLIGI